MNAPLRRPAARPTRERPADGNQRYVSDYPARRPVKFLYAFASTQRPGTHCAAIDEGDGVKRHLQLDDPADVTFFMERLAKETDIEIQGVGPNVNAMRLLVWLNGARVDEHVYLTGNAASTGAQPAADWERLRALYRMAFASATMVRDALELDSERAAFDVNQAAAALFHRAALESAARVRRSE